MRKTATHRFCQDTQVFWRTCDEGVEITFHSGERTKLTEKRFFELFSPDIEPKKTRKPKITAKKWQGDDPYSWAIFVDGRPVFSGLSRLEVPYYRKRAEEAVKTYARSR